MPASDSDRMTSVLADRPTRILFAFLAIAATAAVYWPLPRVYFWADDFVCLLAIKDQGFVRFVLQRFGGHILLVRNLIFYVTYALVGLHPAPYYATVLVTHLLNVWLLFRVIHALTDDAAIACLGATAWGTSPLCIGTLGWYAVFGHVLSTTVMLLVVDALLRRAPRGTIAASTVAGWAGLLLLGTTCFGVGIGVAMAFPIAFALLAPSALHDRRVLTIVLGLAPAVAAFYFAYRRLSAVVEPLSLPEVVGLPLAVSHIAPILAMFGHMLAFGTTGVLFGFFFDRKGYPGAQSHVAVAVAVVAVTIVCMTNGVTRRRCVAFFALTTGAFTVIALGRANFYDALHMSMQTQANQLRYYYAAVAPLVVLLCLVLDRAQRSFRVPAAAILAVWLGVAGVGYVRSSFAVDERPVFRAYTERTRDAIDAAIDAAPMGADVRIPNRRVIPSLLGSGLGPMEFPGWVGLFVLQHPENIVHGHRVYFVETDSALLAAWRLPEKHHRIHDLLIPATP